jgi:ABC-2 type transport system permease protein
VEQLNLLSPAINAQTSFNAVAGSDLPTHLKFQRSAARYHDSLRAFYYPFLFRKVKFTHADYAREPRHTFTSQPEMATARRGLLKLLGSIAAVVVLGFLLVRLNPITPH